VEQLRAIAASDTRFVAAADDYSQSFKQKWGQELEDGSRGSGTAPATPEAINTASVASADPNRPVPSIKQGDKSNPPSRNAFHLTLEQKKVVAGGVGACVALILLAWVVSLLSNGHAMLPAIGSVTVLSSRAYVKEAPKADSPVVVEVRRGESMHLLELPADRTAKWIYVQASPRGKTAKPGYVPLSDVVGWSDWSLDSAESAVRMTIMMCPDSSAPLPELQSCVSRMRALEPKASGGPQEETLRSNIERLDAAIAARQPPPEPQPAVEPPKPEPTADELVARGRYALERAEPPNPRRAAYYANEALKLDKSNSGAVQLLDEIRQYNEAFGSKKN
jgi:hypothetical protein